MHNMLAQIVWSSLLATTVVSLLLYILRNAILTAIKGRIEHAYSVRLESFKAALEKENAKSLIAFKDQLGQRDTLLAYVRSSAAEGQRAVMERRLDATQKLWNDLLSLEVDIPGVVIYGDLLVRDEYRELKSRERGRQLLSEISLPNIERLAARHGQFPWCLIGTLM